MKQKLSNIQRIIRDELETSNEFWLKHGMDTVNGGVYTCLDRTGKVYTTDKSVWMQGRCGWTYAYLCNMYGARPEWLAASKSCIDFLEEHCINKEKGNRLYFLVTADGKPLRHRRYFYSETFYSMANAEYYGATGEKEYLDRALWAYERYWDLWHGAEDPVGLPPKIETRQMRAFGLPMICLNMTSILMRVDPSRRDYYLSRARECVDEIFKYHVHPELKAVLENVALDGSFMPENTLGRLVNPGHDIEGVWFLLEFARATKDKALVAKAEEIFNWAYELGYDHEYGGILYFKDVLGYPPEAYEHDMKLWWVHDETLISSLMLYKDTGKKKYLDIFYEIFEYHEKHFADHEYGECYGYLRRDGKPTEPACKGSTFKGPFHFQRMLTMVDHMISELLER